MKWSDMYEKFEDVIMPKTQIAGLDAVYIISHKEGDKRYKIGITEKDLYNRLRNYQTPFVDFYVHFLIFLPDKGARALEKRLHDAEYLKPKRMKFPQKMKSQKGTSYSEWFQNVSLGVIERTIWRIVKNNSNIIKPYFAIDLRSGSPVVWGLLATYVENYQDDEAETYTTKSGTKHTKTKQIDEGKYSKYIGMRVKSTDKTDKSIGTVIDVPKTIDGKAMIRWSDMPDLPLAIPMKDLIQYHKDFKTKI